MCVSRAKPIDGLKVVIFLIINFNNKNVAKILKKTQKKNNNKKKKIQHNKKYRFLKQKKKKIHWGPIGTINVETKLFEK